MPMTVSAPCYVCHDTTNGDTQRISCGHTFHRQCLIQRIENCLPSCPVDSCKNSKFLFLRTGSNWPDKIHRYIIPESNLTDKTRRAIEQLASFANSDYKQFTTLMLEQHEPVTPNSAFNALQTLVDRCIKYDSEKTIPQDIKEIVDYFQVLDYSDETALKCESFCTKMCVTLTTAAIIAGSATFSWSVFDALSKYEYKDPLILLINCLLIYIFNKCIV